MATVHDVAAFILARCGPLTAMKLQKLCYYSHAWHLVWEERPLFQERIEAWANGPVVRELYNEHRRAFRVEDWPMGNVAHLDLGEQESIDAVLEAYGGISAHDLSELSHREAPWINARKGLPDGARSANPITDAALMEYFDSRTTAPSPHGQGE
ncbi:Panacea domain-containing protein [Brevibacterium sediminis]|uniref:DUF4065 domain-containing protein n=1 Tax=Brevibacterium sediminis TaxID=1857024 RepID=A0A5C4X5T6_9MICO|nr:type II toxin-antitoxin system antitoxin SocA domain-containing protein [Brevibacterium sediminis]TNM55936.1 DUF4065 domain-containing protein [Brevibacterium sediminis]